MTAHPYRDPGILVGGKREFIYPCKCFLINRLSTAHSFDFSPWIWRCCQCGIDNMSHYFICACNHQRKIDEIEFVQAAIVNRLHGFLESGKFIYRFSGEAIYKVYRDGSSKIAGYGVYR